MTALLQPTFLASPTRIHVTGFRVAGITTRTCNRDEQDPATSRIAPLWDHFFSQSWERQLPAATANDGRVYGVYSRYESDAQGAFDVTAGVAVGDSAALAPAAAAVDVQAGEYLVFEGHGNMPQMVLDTWAAVWRYCAHHPQVQRRFGTDFEAYTGPDAVLIYIGVR